MMFNKHLLLEVQTQFKPTVKRSAAMSTAFRYFRFSDKTRLPLFYDLIMTSATL